MAIRFARSNDSRQPRAAQAPVTDIQLQRKDIARLKGEKRGPAVTCLEGAVWITQAGDPRDHILVAGEKFAVNRRGVVLLEAVRQARVEVTS